MKRSGILRKSPDASRLTVRLKRCKAPGCRKEYVPRSSWQKACSPECLIGLSVADVQKAASEAAKASRKADKVKRESLKTRSDWMREAQIAFNAFIRERDALTLCISCHVYLPSIYAPEGGKFDCGHYRSVGSAPHLRFHEHNANGQCKKCNRYGAGRAVDYRIGLIRRIGLEAVEALESDQEPRKWSIAELMEIKATYRAKLKLLQKENGND